jgi:predicted Zn-dependent protease
VKSSICVAVGLLLSGALASAQPLPPQQHQPVGGANAGSLPRPLEVSRLDHEATLALRAKQYRHALELADAGLVRAPQDPWLLYDRGAALAGLGRTDEAIAELARAGQSFPANNPWGRALAAYRRGVALDRAGRHEEARKAFGEYAGVVTDLSVELADQAMRLCEDCPTGP